MTIARAIRWLLALATIVTIVWAFFDVGRRAWRLHVAQRERPITLTILHWGGKDEDQIVETLQHSYESQNPHVRIVRIGTPGSGEMTAKLKTMIKGTKIVRRELGL